MSKSHKPPLRLEICVVQSNFGPAFRDAPPNLIRFDELSAEACEEILSIIKSLDKKFDPSDRFYSFQLNSKK